MLTIQLRRVKQLLTKADINKQERQAEGFQYAFILWVFWYQHLFPFDMNLPKKLYWNDVTNSVELIVKCLIPSCYQPVDCESIHWKQARKLQATLVRVRNYDWPTDSLTDGDEV